MSANVDLCKVPAGTPPAGTTSNLVNPPSMEAATMAVDGIMVAVGILFTAARLYMNFGRLTTADYFVIIALCLSIAILGLQAGLSLKTLRHIWDVPACYFNNSFAQSVYFPALCLMLGCFFAKSSIFLLFKQIFTIQKSMRIAIWVGLAFNFLIYFAGIAVATYYETPHAGEVWVDTLDGRTLIPLPWWQAQSALCIVLDIYIFILPLPALLKLQLPTRNHIALIAVFSIALLGIGASIGSLVERIEISNAQDTTWISAILSLCSTIELNVAIIVSSAPAFSGFARTKLLQLSFVQSLLSSLKSSSKVHDVESGRTSGPVRGIVDSDREPMVGPVSSRDTKHRFYELDDRPRWVQPTSEAYVDDRRMYTTPAANEIMRTVVIDQTSALEDEPPYGGQK